MKQLKLLLAIVLTGIGTAITYHLFENAVHGSINIVWNDWFDTESKRYLVLPLCTALTFAYFGAQHFLDRESENRDEAGLGAVPQPTVKNYLKILGIGFLSLVAGASLGPEAVLVPACMVVGAYIGKQLFQKETKLVNLVAAAGLMALFTAFFHSFFVGVLSLLLVMKQANVKFKPQLLVVAIIASGASLLTLNFISAEAYTQLPSYSWSLNGEVALVSLLLIAAGFIAVHIMYRGHMLFTRLKQHFIKSKWWLNALIAGLGLSTLYLLGGYLVEFTGNQSIEPMFEKAPELGVVGLLWILVVKIGAISWSKALGYRGGMIFPTIFVAAVLVAIVQTEVKDYNLIYGLIAVLIGAFGANKKTKILV